MQEAREMVKETRNRQTPELDKCQRQALKVTFLRWDVILRRLLDVPIKRPETTAFLGQSN